MLIEYFSFRTRSWVEMEHDFDSSSSNVSVSSSSSTDTAGEETNDNEGKII